MYVLVWIKRDQRNIIGLTAQLAQVSAFKATKIRAEKLNLVRYLRSLTKYIMNKCSPPPKLRISLQKVTKKNPNQILQSNRNAGIKVSDCWEFTTQLENQMERSNKTIRDYIQVWTWHLELHGDRTDRSNLWYNLPYVFVKDIQAIR